MYPAKPFPMKVFMSALAGFQGFCSVLGNGSVLAVVVRFKSLRSLPNVLIANLSLVDMFNTVINMPLHLISSVWETSWMRGKALAIITSFFNRLFIILNLASMLALMLNMYVAINFYLKYSAWKKTKKKAVVCSCFIWAVCTLMVILGSISLCSIDLGDAHVIDYRAEIYKQGKYFVAVFMAVFVICGGAIGFLTIRSIKKKKQVRLQNYIKATKTIAMTVAAYFISYVPAIAYAVMGQKDSSQADSWFAFVAWAATFFSSVVNPIIYYVRTSRFRSAFKQFLKDPFGSSDFKEKQTGKGVRKGNLGTDASKKNGKKIASKSQEMYHGSRRNGISVVPVEALQINLYGVLKETERGLDGTGNLRKGEDLGLISTPSSNTVSTSVFYPEIRGREVWALEQKTMMVKEKTPSEGTGVQVNDQETFSHNTHCSLESELRGATNFPFKRKADSARDNGFVKNQHQTDKKGGISGNSLPEDQPETREYPAHAQGMTMLKRPPFERTEVEPADKSEVGMKMSQEDNSVYLRERNSTLGKKKDMGKAAGLPSQQIGKLTHCKPMEGEQLLEETLGQGRQSALPSVCI